MNIIIYTLVFLGIAYFLLKLVANTSSKKISKHLRKLIFLGLIILAILLVVAGKFLLSIPLTLLSLALVKLKGFSIFQLIGLFRLIQTLRRSGRFSFNQYQNKQNNQINSLLGQINELQAIERKLYGDDMKYSSVKSFKGKTLTLTPVNKDYLINVNNNCLHIGNNDQLKLKICNHIFCKNCIDKWIIKNN